MPTKPKAAAEKIAAAIEPNEAHDEEGLTQVDARWTREVAGGVAVPNEIVLDLLTGSTRALKGLPMNVPQMVFQKTHDLRHLLEQAKSPTPSPTPEPNDGPVE